MDEKIDVLDFVINVLREHEKSLSESVSRLEESIKEIESRIAASKEGMRGVKVLIDEWREFRRQASKPESAYFKLADCFQVEALKEGRILQYREAMPELMVEAEVEEEKLKFKKLYAKSAEDVASILNMKLKCGLKATLKTSTLKLSEKNVLINIRFEFDRNGVRNWLSKELSISASKVVEGEILVG